MTTDMPIRTTSLSVVLLCVLSTTILAQHTPRGDGGRKNAKDTDTWSAEEYSGLRGEKEIRTAMASKGFAWITGSPADNEKLSIGKNAQFFGFVALRYQSGRAANRGTLGRAMFSIATESQRDVMSDAVRNESASLNEWWAVRDEILSVLEDHSYTGMQIDEASLVDLGERYSLLNSDVAIHEARAYAAFEDLMSRDQADLIANWRLNPEAAEEYGRRARVEDERLEGDDWKLLEDLYAKCFSWISGRREDNEIIPIGQPAQLFGFVSIRHKSGRGANRGDIAKNFYRVLDSSQRAFINRAVEEQAPLVRRFLEARHLYLDQLELLRVASDEFDRSEADKLARRMGQLEMAIAKVEAEAYRDIRATMSDEQLLSAMNLRGEYVVDESQTVQLDTKERGATLSVLCAGCHGTPGTWRAGMVGPDLDGFWGRPIASDPSFEYSDALRTVSDNGHKRWTAQSLDAFLANPRAFAPGTKMEFQGFLSPDDRQAIIEYLETEY
ncbi:MAG: c-type cytochrome [Pseudomonadota bacterium]